MADDLTTATQFHTFANNSGLRPLMLNDPNTASSLVNLLKSTNPAALKKALEVIFVLASDPQTAQQTSKLPGLLVTLANLHDFELECPENASIRRLAQQNMACLTKSSARRPSTATSGATERVEVRAQQHRAGAFGSKYNHQVSFSVPTLVAEGDKEAIENLIIHVKGTLAVTVDLGKKTIHCFTSTEPTIYNPQVVEELAKHGYAGAEVVVNDKKSGRGHGQGAGAELVAFNKKGSQKKGQQEAGWLGSISSYFW